MLASVALVIVGLGIVYLVATAGGALAAAPGRRIAVRGASAPEPTHVFYLVPCLNEELVVRDTVEGLLADPRAWVVVVDDGSDDRTVDIVREIDGERLDLVRRHLPDARLGKGRALNAGLARIRARAALFGLAPEHVVVCVMDADGRLSAGCLDHVLPLFSDPTVGGVQLPVRIRNRERLIGRVQDIEFSGLTASCQVGRTRTGSVSLGGNGQFTRLSALNSVPNEPWSDSLTEDLDLSISLMTGGWRLASTPHAHVSQQGVESVRALVRQRTRWYQGHMTCGARLPELWRSRNVSHGTVLEVTGYLAVPWVQVLPWSLIFHVAVWQTIVTVTEGGWAILGHSTTARIVGVVLWYLLLFLPSVINGAVYHRRTREGTLLRSILLAHLLIPAGYVAYVACWKGLANIVIGRRGWAKTARAEEAVIERRHTPMALEAA